MINACVLAVYARLFPDNAEPLPPVPQALAEIECEVLRLRSVMVRLDEVQRQIDDLEARVRGGQTRPADDILRAHALFQACVTTSGFKQHITDLGFLLAVAHLETLCWVLRCEDHVQPKFPETLAILDRWLRHRREVLERTN